MVIHHVLYVDSDFEAKRKAVILLFSNGYEVVPVSSIKQALTLLRSIPTDLVIGAVHLPDGDIGHLLQTIKSSPSLNKIPVLAMDVAFDKASREALMKMGAAGYTVKGGEPKDLLDLVKQTIYLHRNEERQSAIGLSGQLAKTKIADLILQLAKEHGTGFIHIDGSVPMEIHLRDGGIVHARHGITVGKKALFRCLMVAEAAFDFKAEHTVIEPTVEGDLSSLLAEAKSSNEKLMANFHRLAHPNHRARIVKLDVIEKTNLKPEERAALAIIFKYPRVGSFLDRLNLPDVVCHELLLSFIERGLVELVVERKPVKIFTDSSCDIPKQDWDELDINVLPLGLNVNRRLFATPADAQDHGLYDLKPKLMEQAKTALPDDTAILDAYISVVPTHDCLSIFMGGSLSGLFNRVQDNLSKLQVRGINGKTLLANELTVINSHSISLGLWLLVVRAARLAKKGMQIEQIEERLLQNIARLHLMFAVVPDRSPLIKKGNAPVLLYWDGDEFQVLQRLAKGADPVAALTGEIALRLDPKSRVHYVVGHIVNPQQANVLQERLVKDHGFAKKAPVSMGPLVGYRLGRGAVGIAFFQE